MKNIKECGGGKMKRYKSDIMMIAITIALGILMVTFSENIFKGGFISDKLSKNVKYYKATVLSIED